MLDIFIKGPAPTPPPTPGLNHIPALVLTIVLWGTVLIVIYLGSIRKVEFTIRRITGLDRIGDSMGRAVEMGKSVYLEARDIMPVGDVGIATFSIYNYIGRQAAKLDANLQIFLPADQIMNGVYVEDNMRQAYDQEGKQFDRNKQMRYEGMGQAHEMILVSYFYSEKPATYMQFFTGDMSPSAGLAEELNRANVLAIIGTPNIAWETIYFDEAIIGEEIIAAGAYLSGDPTLTASIVSSDIIQYIMMTFILVVVVADQFFGLGLSNMIINYWRGT